MSHALARPSIASRSGLLGVVLALHLGVLLVVAAAKVLPPRELTAPIEIALLAPAAEPESPHPVPVSKPQAQPHKANPAPKAAQPALEATQSKEPSANAPQAAANTTPSPQAPAGAERATATPGETLTQARFDAAYLNNPAPAYPPLSRKQGEQGLVILRVLVNPQGQAENLEIKTSSGSTRLDEAALRTVRNWKFVPAKRGENPVQSWVLVPINFKLEQ
ncbi:MAG: energy transducer TonB [Rhodocyclales bacterium]|nr:energy transducer TonB [Rhodocyclales bacterium]